MMYLLGVLGMLSILIKVCGEEKREAEWWDPTPSGEDFRLVCSYTWEQGVRHFDGYDPVTGARGWARYL